MTINLVEAMTGRITRLRFVKRFSNCPRIHEESVAEHSFYTAFFTMLMCMRLGKKGMDVNVGIAVIKALMHDVDECFSGDFIRSFKHSDPLLKMQIDLACDKFQRMFSGSLSTDETLSNTIFNVWKESKLETEGKIVSYADFLSVVSYIAQEVDSGNSRMLEHVDELRHYFNTFLAIEYGFLKEFMEDANLIITRLETQRDTR